MTTATETLEVTANIKHLLAVLSARVNSTPYAPVREYLANAHDASIGMQNPKLRIWAQAGVLHIEDSGRGMSRSDILSAFTCIGGHRAPDESEAIGQFGLGKLSAFMIAHRIEVETLAATERSAWRISWERDASTYQLSPDSRGKPGTHAALHLSPEFHQLASEQALRDFVAREFGLLSMPIFVGSDHGPANPFYQWSGELSRYSRPQLLPLPEAKEVIKKYCSVSVSAAYIRFHKGARIILGIPSSQHSPLDNHKVAFFSKGVLVQRQIRAFFPENYAFVVALIDHPGLALQIDREGLVQDRVFQETKRDMEGLILDFLSLLSDTEPQIMTHLLRIHRAMLLAQIHCEPRLRELFRKHYLFSTNAGQKRWRELIGFAKEVKGRRSLYVLSDKNFQYHKFDLARESGTLVVMAEGAEAELLQDLGAADGVQTLDVERLAQDQLAESCPPEFHVLATLLSAPLMRHGIGDISLVYLPHDPKPAVFRIETTESQFLLSDVTGAAAAANQGRMVGITGLILNVGHSLVQNLAMRGPSLSGQLLQQAADVLYGVAALQSPFPEARLRVTHQLMESLVNWIQYLLDIERDPLPVNKPNFSIA